LAPPDIDNIIKPILDALNGLVYNDDQQVYRVTSQRFDLPAGDRVSDPGALLAEALLKYSEILHIVVTWEEEG
jgi:crossover junction endodeoxyribonuclease RusA